MDKMEPPPQYNASSPYPYPQPPPVLPSQSAPSAPTIVVTTGSFGPTPQHLVCPHCHANISTRVETESNMKTHLIALLLCALGCWCCVPCPYCMDNCLVKKHYCPACSSYLGSCEN